MFKTNSVFLAFVKNLLTKVVNFELKKSKSGQISPVKMRKSNA